MLIVILFKFRFGKWKRNSCVINVLAHKRNLATNTGGGGGGKTDHGC
jgi:hypothetical protein